MGEKKSGRNSPNKESLLSFENQKLKPGIFLSSNTNHRDSNSYNHGILQSQTTQWIKSIHPAINGLKFTYMNFNASSLSLSLCLCLSLSLSLSLFYSFSQLFFRSLPLSLSSPFLFLPFPSQFLPSYLSFFLSSFALSYFIPLCHSLSLSLTPLQENSRDSNRFSILP